MEHEGSSPCSQQPTDSPSQEPDDTRPHPSIPFHYAQFYYPPIYDKVSHAVSFLQVSPTKTFQFSPTRVTSLDHLTLPDLITLVTSDKKCKS